MWARLEADTVEVLVAWNSELSKLWYATTALEYVGNFSLTLTPTTTTLTLTRFKCSHESLYAVAFSKLLARLKFISMHTHVLLGVGSTCTCVRPLVSTSGECPKVQMYIHCVHIFIFELTGGFGVVFLLKLKYFEVMRK